MKHMLIGERYRQQQGWDAWYFPMTTDLPADSVLSAVTLVTPEGSVGHQVYLQTALNKVQYGVPAVAGGNVLVYPLDMVSAPQITGSGYVNITSLFQEFLKLQGDLKEGTLLGIWIARTLWHENLSLMIEWIELPEETIHVTHETNGHVAAMKRKEKYG